MPAPVHRPVLIIGGSGIVGAQAAQALRRLQPDLPITIGGRDLAKAEAVARKVGGADAAAIDLARPDLGQPDRAFAAVVVFVKDAGLNSLRFAQARGVPHISCSDASTRRADTVTGDAWSAFTIPARAATGAETSENVAA